MLTPSDRLRIETALTHLDSILAAPPRTRLGGPGFCDGELTGLRQSAVNLRAALLVDEAERAQTNHEALVERCRALEAAAREVLCRALEAAAREVLKHRNGDLPVRGWLNDNDASREALAALAKLVP
jgi:hypothetical protein